MKTITKNRYNIKIALLTLVAGLLFLTVLLSALILFVSGAFLPLIISVVLFITFTIFARIKYGLKIIEPLNDEDILKQNDSITMSDNNSSSLSNAIYISNINHDTIYNK